MKKAAPLNLLELKPARRAQWEAAENGRIVLLVPKFRSRLLVTWILPLLAKPHFRVKLDEFGSFVWSRCDGSTRVEHIAEELKAAFGDRAEPLYERLGRFITRLDRSGLIAFKDPDIRLPNMDPGGRQPTAGTLR